MKTQRVTMRDVALRANVSLNTVSLAIKGSDLLLPATKAAVMAIVHELGYVPNQAARNLRQGIVRTIGLMVPDIHNPHFWDIADGVENESRKHGYGVVLSNANLDPMRELESLRGLTERRYDGLILATHFLHDDQVGPVQEHLHPARPIVTFTRSWSRVDRVCYYREAVGLLVLEHLYALGHRRIGFVLGIAREGLADERLRAYRDFVQGHDLPDLVEHCGPAIADGVAASHRLLGLAAPPTAIVAVNDYLAQAVIRAACDRGLCVPHDLSVAGFDNTSIARNIVPSLTSVDVGGSAIGETAARLLFERLAEPDRPPQLVEMPARLVERESTARARE